MAHDDLITIREAAELAGVPVRTMRHRLTQLNERHGGKLLQSFEREGSVRKWWLRPSVLLALTRTDQQAADARVDSVDARAREAEGKLLALRGAHRKLRSRVESGFARQEAWNRNQQQWREGAETALRGLKVMLDASGSPES